MDECARMGCDNVAVALLSFAPRHAKAWLYDLIDPNPANGIVLCRRHANATVVPMSWQLVDARDPSWEGPTAPVPPLEPTIEQLLARHFAALEPLHRTDDEVAAAPDLAEPVAATAPQAEPVDALVGRAVTSDRVRDQRDGWEADLAPRSTVGMRAADRPMQDMALFELPLDEPAVTQHPGWG